MLLNLNQKKRPKSMKNIMMIEESIEAVTTEKIGRTKKSKLLMTRSQKKTINLLPMKII